MKKVKCPYCGKEVAWLNAHLYKYHKLPSNNPWVTLLTTRETEINELEKKIK